MARRSTNAHIEILTADYHNPKHASDVVALLNGYAQDPMGGGTSLSPYVLDNLAADLGKRDNAFSVLCYVDDKPAGLVNCFEVFSTFACKPIINIHDVTVEKPYRGLGLSKKMMLEVERIAKARGCVKITLEVLQGNEIAKNAYQKLGYAGYEMDPTLGVAEFWQKPI